MMGNYHVRFLGGKGGEILLTYTVILKNAAMDIVEMNPNGDDNLCCGGGGGQLAMSEYNTRRMSIAKIKAD